VQLIVAFDVCENFAHLTVKSLLVAAWAVRSKHFGDLKCNKSLNCVQRNYICSCRNWWCYIL